jgi:hypothetical protein
MDHSGHAATKPQNPILFTEGNEGNEERDALVLFVLFVVFCSILIGTKYSPL